MSGRAMVLGVMPSNHWTRYPVRGAHGLGVSTISWPGLIRAWVAMPGGRMHMRVGVVHAWLRAP